MRLIGVLAISLALAGCGIAAKVNARNGYEEATAKYKQCLEANPASPQNCEGLRLAMEAEERQYNNLSAGITPGGQTSSNISILSR
jgi:hypothetical protein